MNVFNVTFRGYEGKQEVAKIETQMSNEELIHFTSDSVKNFISENHPEGNKLKLTNALASVGDFAYRKGDQIELF